MQHDPRLAELQDNAETLRLSHRRADDEADRRYRLYVRALDTLATYEKGAQGL